VFVTINTALLTIFAAYHTIIDSLGIFLLSLLDFGSALAWYQAATLGKYYCLREEVDAIEIAKETKQCSMLLGRWAEKPRGKRPRGLRPSVCIKLVSLVISFIWLGIFLSFLLSLIPNI